MNTATETRTTTTAGELLDQLRVVLDEIDALNQQLKPLNAMKVGIQNDLIRLAQSQGTDRFGNDRISVTISDKTVARIDPEQWEGLYQWAVKTGNTHVLYRQLSAGKLEELSIQGVALPDGLSLEIVPTCNTRRK